MQMLLTIASSLPTAQGVSVKAHLQAPTGAYSMMEPSRFDGCSSIMSLLQSSGRSQRLDSTLGTGSMQEEARAALVSDVEPGEGRHLSHERWRDLEDALRPIALQEEAIASLQDNQLTTVMRRLVLVHDRMEQALQNAAEAEKSAAQGADKAGSAGPDDSISLSRQQMARVLLVVREASEAYVEGTLGKSWLPAYRAVEEHVKRLVGGWRAPVCLPVHHPAPPGCCCALPGSQGVCACRDCAHAGIVRMHAQRHLST